jgi:hypothetical protein
MSERPVRPKEYFAKLLAIPGDKIDYSDIPATTTADWEGAEALFPVTAEEFRAIKEFIRDRRKNAEKVNASADGERSRDSQVSARTSYANILSVPCRRAIPSSTSDMIRKTRKGGMR